MEENEFKLTYYIGPMLAQGGTLTIAEDRLTFAPGTLERALGANDTVIPFADILLVDVTGLITESLIIKTQEKIHRFVGGNPHAIKDRINASIQKSGVRKTVAPAVQPSATQTVPTAAPAIPSPAVPKQTQPGAGYCPTCAKQVAADFSFCPFCKTVLAKSCSRCFKKVQSDWKYCGYCGNIL